MCLLISDVQRKRVFLGMLLLLSRHFSLTGLSTLQKRRSGRQVKRRKYNEDLDFKVVDDDGETIAVLGAGRTSALSASTLAWQAEVWLWVGVLTAMLLLVWDSSVTLRPYSFTTL